MAGKFLFNGTEFILGVNENVLGLDSGEGYTFLM